jgi:hypothetical protein
MEIIERDSTKRDNSNSSLNKYKFLITLIHEISHLVAFENLDEK